MLYKNSYTDLRFLNTTAYLAAPALLGSLLVRTLNNEVLIGRIVEVEAYDEADAASHSFAGRTVRNSATFEAYGIAYVYFTYGMHYCMNVVCGEEGHGAAILIRAVEPLQGLNTMLTNRHTPAIAQLTNGPAKLCQAFQVDLKLNKHDLTKPPLMLQPGSLNDSERILQTKRIGISKNTDKLWRFYLSDNGFVSGLKNA